jgi:uncharacterized repeat protein (TIGR01451 family)
MKTTLYPLLLLVLTMLSGLYTKAQIVDPFTILQQRTLRGDITIAANVNISCGASTGACGTAQANNALGNSSGPNDNTINNNNYTLSYVDADGTSTFGGLNSFSSSRSFLNLNNNPGCNVVAAYLVWGGHINTLGTNYAIRDSVYIKAPGATTNYTGLRADFKSETSIGITSGNANDRTYQCYKDITDLIRASGQGDYWVANVVTLTGVSNVSGGWSIIVMYGDETLPLRNLTIFKGYAYITNTALGPQNIPISGFYTPPSPAPVNIKLGVFVLEGDKGSAGDSLKFNGIAVDNGLHHPNNFFNSTISIEGVSINGPTQPNPGNPNYTNTLGYDADITTLNNSTNIFLTNSASSATLRYTTSADNYWPFIVTTAIDVFEPNIFATKDWVDDNGGQVELGDIITYNIKVYNKGVDPATQVVLTDSLYGAMSYVPGSATVVTGPNAGAKTDAIGDDQFDINAMGNELKFRLGNTANGTTGGQLGFTAATDSVTTLSFKVRVTNDCLMFKCSNELRNIAYVNFNGFTSGDARRILSDAEDINAYGCPSQGITRLSVVVPPCIPPADTVFNGCITPYNLSLLQIPRPGYTRYLNNTFATVTQATTAEIYYAVRELYPGCTDTLIADFRLTCPVPIELLSFNANYNGNQVVLQWKTATELNNREFQLERSIDGINFEKIATIPGAINSNTIKTYNYTDGNLPATKTVYYRLIQIDVNDALKISGVKTVHLLQQLVNVIRIDRIIPNPVTDNVTLQVNTPQLDNVVVRILDLNGKLVSSQYKVLNSGNQNIPFNMAGYGKGIYIVEVLSTKYGQKTIARIVKQ